MWYVNYVCKREYIGLVHRNAWDFGSLILFSRRYSFRYLTNYTVGNRYFFHVSHEKHCGGSSFQHNVSA